MIAIFIFYIHIIGAVSAFSKSYVDHRIGDAFMTLAFVAIIFSVGWTIAGFIVRFVIPHAGFGPWLDRDTISLVIVTLLEAVLYGLYFLRRRSSGGATAA